MNIRPEQTVADLVIRHPEWRERLEKMGIDYCCGGKRPLRQVVAAAGLEWQAFLAALNDTSAPNAADSVNTNWNEVPLGVLVDHILEKHHVFTRGQVSRLDGLLPRVEAAHGAKHGEMLARLRRLYDGLRDELDAHLMKEEQILFPAIKEIDAFISGRGRKPVIHCGSVANPIHQMEIEHDKAGRALGECWKSRIIITFLRMRARPSMPYIPACRLWRRICASTFILKTTSCSRRALSRKRQCKVCVYQ